LCADSSNNFTSTSNRSRNDSPRNNDNNASAESFCSPPQTPAPQSALLTTQSSSFSSASEPQAAQQAITPGTKRKLFDYSIAREKLHKTSTIENSFRAQIGNVSCLNQNISNIIMFDFVYIELQVSNYLSTFENVKEEDEEIDVFEFWLNNSGKLSYLYLLAVKYLAIPATSSPVERLFSFAGYIMRPHRSRLTREHVERQVLLKCNLDMIKKES
jgi:hypothetical protein